MGTVSSDTVIITKTATTFDNSGTVTISAEKGLQIDATAGGVTLTLGSTSDGSSNSTHNLVIKNGLNITGSGANAATLTLNGSAGNTAADVKLVGTTGTPLYHYW